MKRVRSDKKFGVKVWIKKHNKNIFRQNCMKYHLSMMFVGEKYLRICLDDFSIEQLDLIINERLQKVISINPNRDGYDQIGIRLTNDYWQKLAYFAVRYDTSVVKIATCIFDYALSAYEVKLVEDNYGLKVGKK